MNTTITTISSNCPRFFGVSANCIRTETDAVNAIKHFCEMAPAEVVSATVSELKALSEINPDLYNLINRLIWKAELPIGSYAWQNHFELLNAELK